MSSPRDNVHNIQTCEAGATSQPAESGSHDFSRAHSTGLESMGTSTISLRQRATELTSTQTGLPQRHEFEPRLGAVKLMSFPPEIDRVGYGEKGASMFTLMVDISDEVGTNDYPTESLTRISLLASIPTVSCNVFPARPLSKGPVCLCRWAAHCPSGA